MEQQLGISSTYLKKTRKKRSKSRSKRSQLMREQSVRTQRHITFDEIGRRIALGQFKELNVILGDVDGSVKHF
jgi:translation initiation factor IF-2